MKILFATSNLNKAAEVSSMLPEHFEILTLKDIDHTEDIPETSPTIKGNAMQKANFILENYKIDCFADDTGLEITALDGEPGVVSARYAGEDRSDDANMALVLDKLNNESDRSAQFRTVIALNIKDMQLVFEGIVKGTILKVGRGENGFGYDPIFEPENCGKSFAEMTMDEKNSYSHRARAFAKMIEYLNLHQ
ncbi:MAG: RdgB/HAM1 family non-canonical purine NTP pyrophosphatase [Crocinitomicaceae bacterium]|nr:RdgB/HAM1 family non-canonical purine NTP pyrophosphatase [Crocinitomicaceae bacterium]MDC1384436.1 RdgB/HAM1 family non-canonical purine NTP pyrophosphatase [Crocinitomicaceae bacterium]